MRAHLIGAAGAAALAQGAHGSFTFGDIEFWAGAGANHAALVIDWNDAKPDESVAWGFRWDGAATGQDMLLAVVAADPNLYARVAVFGFGTAVVGLGQDTDADGFAVTNGTTFDPTGVSTEGPSDGGLPLDPDDHYAEGWSTGFWKYFLAGDSPYDGGAWAEAQVGLSGRPLASGDWDGLSFAPDFTGPEPGTPIAAVPAPGAAILVGVGTATSTRDHRRRRRPGR
jgi:hypothetical protein